MNSIILRNFCDWLVCLSSRLFRFAGPDALNVDANRLRNLFPDPLRCLSPGNDLIYCLARDIEFSGQHRLGNADTDHGDPDIVRAHSGRFQVYRSRFHFFWPPVKFDVEIVIYLINDVVKIKMMHSLKFANMRVKKLHVLELFMFYSVIDVFYHLASLYLITDAENMM